MSALSEEAVTRLRGSRLPVSARLAGYSALIAAFDLPVPLHHTMAATSPKNVRRKEDGWAIYPASSRPPSNAVDHLIFAFKHEGVELLTLKRLFERMDRRELERAASLKPTSGYLRRLCFLFEWLMHDELALPDASAGAYVPVLDASHQYGTATAAISRRFRVKDNLPGTSDFCPLVRRTPALDRLIGLDLDRRARALVDGAPPGSIARAAAFLLLSDSKASFAIEGENPPKDRIARWGRVIGQAGQLRLDVEQILRLQRELIGDDRFIRIGLRQDGGFIGRHDALGQPEPEHVSANARDLSSLLDGMLAFGRIGTERGYHPVLAAASMAFGFVYVHPFEDGNGRIHRFLLHHVLAERRFTPAEIVFPLSSAILDDIARYRDILEAVSRPLLDWADWQPTDRGNVWVLNDTGDHYRYFDATAHAEFLFRCIERAVDRTLPEELAFLEHRDAFHRRATEVVDMGERTLDLMLRFLRQNHGTFSQCALRKEFTLLTGEEVGRIETIYGDVFG